MSKMPSFADYSFLSEMEEVGNLHCLAEERCVAKEGVKLFIQWQEYSPTTLIHWII